MHPLNLIKHEYIKAPHKYIRLEMKNSDQHYVYSHDLLMRSGWTFNNRQSHVPITWWTNHHLKLYSTYAFGEYICNNNSLPSKGPCYYRVPALRLIWVPQAKEGLRSRTPSSDTKDGYSFFRVLVAAGSFNGETSNPVKAITVYAQSSPLDPHFINTNPESPSPKWRAYSHSHCTVQSLELARGSINVTCRQFAEMPHCVTTARHSLNTITSNSKAKKN